MIRLASELSHDPYHPHRLVVHRPPQPLSEGSEVVSGASDRLAAVTAERVRDGIRADVRQAVRDEYESLVRRNPARATLTAADLTQLARDIAQSAAEPVGNHLKGHIKGEMIDIQQKLQQNVRDAVRSSLEESVTGPPLTNFVGYLAIELDRRGQGEEPPPVRAEGGTIKASVGQRVSLVISVVRDERAKNLGPVIASRPDTDFFVFEPVRVEGGRDAPTVLFEAMADSSTLTPLPHRKNLVVGDEVQAAFAFQLPTEAGSHEVWFQLYQAAHLVQVVALKIEAEAVASAPGSDDATGDSTGAV
jgi:hypothetical protein